MSSKKVNERLSVEINLLPQSESYCYMVNDKYEIFKESLPRIDP